MSNLRKAHKTHKTHKTRKPLRIGTTTHGHQRGKLRKVSIPYLLVIITNTLLCLIQQIYSKNITSRELEVVAVKTSVASTSILQQGEQEVMEEVSFSQCVDNMKQF